MSEGDHLGWISYNEQVRLERIERFWKWNVISGFLFRDLHFEHIWMTRC